MELRPLGRTGVSVSNLCLGTMMFGDWGTKDHDESIKIIHWALDAGVNFVDTADVYSQGESEVIVGKALQGRRDDVVLATKFFMPFDDDPNHRGASRVDKDHPAATPDPPCPRTLARPHHGACPLPRRVRLPRRRSRRRPHHPAMPAA